MDGANSYFAITMFFLVFLMVLMAISLCCGCSPSRLAKKRQEEAWKAEIREMMQKDNKVEMEEGLEAEGWTEVNGGMKGHGGLPRLVEGA